MNKPQTYVIYYEDNNGKMIDFERAASKRISTVLKHIRILFNTMKYSKWFYNDNILKAEDLVIYSTKENGDHIAEVYRTNIKEFYHSAVV